MYVSRRGDAPLVPPNTTGPASKPMLPNVLIGQRPPAGVVYQQATPSSPASPAPQVPAAATGAPQTPAPVSVSVPQQVTTAQYVGDQFAAPQRRPKRSRTRTYTIAFVLFTVISVGGYFGFRQYIYGADAPPVIDLDGN